MATFREVFDLVDVDKGKLDRLSQVVAQVVAQASTTESAQTLCLTSCSLAGGSIDGTEVKQLLLLLGIQASPEQVSAMIAGIGCTKYLTALADC